MKRTIIIGGGLGGLTTGALLSKKGFDVTLLEQHEVIGGCATTFKRKGGFTCEVGLHELDGLYTDKQKREIFEELGVYKNLEFIKPNEFFKLKTEAIEFIMPEGFFKAKEKLILYYPKDAKDIKKYFDLIENIALRLNDLLDMKFLDICVFPIKFWNILKYKNKSVKEVFDLIFSNEELKLILNTNLGYYGDNEKSLSFLLHAAAQYSYLNGGCWYIKGGSSKLSEYLAKVIRDNGGNIITKANVVQIDSKVKTIKYQKRDTIFSVPYDIVISNLSPQDTYKLAQVKYIEKKEISASFISIYIGFKQNIKSVYGKRAYSTFFFKDLKKLDDYSKMGKKDVKDRGFSFVDYSQIDSGLCDDSNKSFGVLCSTDYLEDWKLLSESSYGDKKEEVLHSYLTELEKYYPNITENIEFAEVSTPKTIQRYIKTPNATVLGFAPTKEQFFKIPNCKSKKIKSLYFVGQWIFGGGFSPSINSGGFCAKQVLKDFSY